MKKRLLTIILSLVTVLCLAFALASCGKKTDTGSNGGGSNDTAHTHAYATAWSSDSENHWRACTGSGCDSKSDLAAHVYDNDADTTCNICGYERAAHTHTATVWANDDTYHWHDCTVSGCGEQFDKAEHAWNAGEITTPATEATPGVKTYTCTVCQKTRTESVSALGYTIAFDSQGGSTVASITKDAGETVTAPADPERTGFVFLGWFADKDQSIFEGATPYVFDTMPENNVTLYAKWALNLAVSYEGQDATVAMTAFSVTKANEDVMFVVDFEKINCDKSYIGVPMYRYEGETRIGLDTEVAKVDSTYVSAVFDNAMQNVYTEGDVLWRYGAGDFYIKHDFSENGRYFISIKYATPGEYEIGVKVFNWKATPTLELKDGVSKNKTYDGQPVSVTADDYTTNSDGEVTVLWYDWSKNALANAPVNAGVYYFKLQVSETSTADGDATEFRSKTTDYYKVVISAVEVNVETPHNFTYNGNTEYYVDYSTSAVNGERLMAYFVFAAYDGVIELDDCGFEVWGEETTEYSNNYVLVYEGSGDMATLTQKVISDLTLRVNYNGTTSFTGIAGDKATSTDIINKNGINDFENLIFSVKTSNKNASATAYTVDFANVVIGGEAAPFYTLAESGSASVYIDPRELTNLNLATTEAWTESGSVEITLTETNGICTGDVVKVTITNGNHQDMTIAGETCDLVLGTAGQGQEVVALVASGDYGNYVLAENDDGIVGTVMIVGVIKNISFTSSDITSIVNRGGMNVITINLTTAHGNVAGHDVYLEIMTTATTGTISIGSTTNTVVKGTDADKYALGTGCTVNFDVTTLSNISFTSSDITSATPDGSNVVIKISLTTAHGITDGDTVELQITVSSRDVTNKATVTLTSGNTVISGTDAAKYALGTGCTVTLG